MNEKESAKQYEFHPLCERFPLLEGKEFQDLVESIGKNGLYNRIVLLDGKIIDGRNRYRACMEAGVDPSFRRFSGDDHEAMDIVKAMNLDRRHLTEAQRADLILDLFPALAKRGRPEKGSTEPFIEQAAKQAKVGRSTLKRVAKVRQRGIPLLKRALKDGKVSARKAEAVAKLAPAKQEEIARKPKAFAGYEPDAGRKKLSAADYYTSGPVTAWTRDLMSEPARESSCGCLKAFDKFVAKNKDEWRNKREAIGAIRHLLEGVTS